MVVVVRGDYCCGNESDVGKIFTIAEISAGVKAAKCKHCGTVTEDVLAWDGVLGTHDRSGYYFGTLQKIRPVKKQEKTREAELKR
jgi:hypothetical protein